MICLTNARMGGVCTLKQRMEVMTDEPMSLHDAFEKAQSTLQSSSEEAPEEEVQSEETKVKEETPAKDTKDNQIEAADLEKIDPKTLPPELKPHYDNLMKGFTQGRQKDSEARKAAEEKAASLEKKMAELEAKLQPKQEPDFQELTPQQLQVLTPQEQAQYFSLLAEYKATKAVERQRVEDFRTQALTDYESTDVRLQKPSDGKPNEKYDRFMDSAIGTEMDSLLSDYVATNGTEVGFPYKEHLSRLIGEWDGFLKQKFDQFISGQNEKIKTESGKVNKLSPPTSKAPAVKGKMSIQEALKAAMEKTGFSK